MVRRGRSRGGQQARPTGQSRVGAPPRLGALLGWIAGAAALAGLVWLSGLAGTDAELPQPTPSATPEGPLPVHFGTALDPATREVSEPVDRFRAGDPFAYSVRLPAPRGDDIVFVRIARIEGETRTVVQESTEQEIAPPDPVLSVTLRAVDLVEAFGPGDYLLELSWYATSEPFASGSFTLVESPVEP